MIQTRLSQKLRTIVTTQSQAAEAMEHSHPATLPVILYYCKPPSEVRRCIIERYGPIKYELPFIRAMALDLPVHKLKAIAKEPMVQWITEDATVSKVGINPPLRAGSTWPVFDGLRGLPPMIGRGPGGRRPVSVAVIDTGVALHPDLLWPTNRIRAFFDLIHHRSDPYDDDGHGTHIAGILCGLAKVPQGERLARASRNSEAGEKPAWNPSLVAIKALDEQGNGNASDILAAMQWTLNNSRFYNTRVVNLSLGVTADDEYDSDPLVRGVEALTRHGLTVVTAAGNSGPKRRTISSPGICESAITVGALDTTADRAHIATFSSRGPTPQGLIKPDLVAPGVEIQSLDADETARRRGGRIAQSGTSMAAPFVSRAVAAIYETFPQIEPATVKRILLSQTKPLIHEPPEAQGRGVLSPSM